MGFLKRTTPVLVVAVLVGLLYLVAGCTQPPVAGLTTDKNIAAVNEAIQFTDQSTGEFTSCSWNFGDGTTSTEQNPSHTYTKKGDYTASLTVSNKAGSDTKTLAITVLEPPIASFTTDKTKVTVNEAIQFTDQSTGEITSCSWDFGDGTTSTERNPSYAYTKGGRYTASLTVSNEVGSDTKTLAIAVLVPPVASFMTDETKVSVNEAVQFTDQSTGEITSCSWDFGDGTTSTEQNPSHTYTKKGDYTASLTVSNKAGTDTKTLAITVLEPPIANFSASKTKAQRGSSIQFTDESSGDIDSWKWDFGDGGSSTEQNPSHTYKDAGTYTVTLMLSNPVSSDTRVKTDYITITSLAISRIEMCSNVTEQGDYTIQPDAVFHVGDSPWLYFEVTGFDQLKTNSKREIWVQWQQLDWYDPNGDLLLTESDGLEFHDIVEPMIGAYVWFRFHLGEAESTDPLGEYRMEVKVEDKLSGETAIESITFILE